MTGPHSDAHTHQVHATLDLPQPPNAVWAVLLPTAWSAWNPQLLRMEGTLAAGQPCTLHVQPVRRLLPARFAIRMLRVEPGCALVWQGPRGAERALLRAEHGFVLEAGGAGTLLTHYERFEGPLAGVLWPMLGRWLSEGHQRLNDALVSHVTRDPRG